MRARRFSGDVRGRFHQLGLVSCILFLAACGGQPREPEMDPMSGDEQAAVVDRLSELLSEYYVFADVAEEYVRTIKSNLASGAYDGIERPNLFAAALNRDLAEVSDDHHLRIVALFGVGEEGDPSAAYDALDDQHFLERGNHGLMRVEWLRGNVGYLDLRAFSSIHVTREKLAAAMRLLSDMDAIIIDLRSEVRGGSPETVRFLASYFFDTPTHINTLYFRRDDVHEEYWTLEHVPGPRMADVPLFVLTDEDVFSAGESFTYALQALDRATVIGEPTRGGAHITRAFRIGHRFEARIPWGRAINPTTGTNWEGKGITPDIQVRSKDALDTALDLAREAADLRRTDREAQDVAALDDLMASLRAAEGLFALADMDAASSATRAAIERGILSGVLNEGSIDDLGNRFLQRGAVEMAIEVLSLNTVLYPESEWVHYRLAEALVQRGERKKAEESLSRCLQLNPRNPWATKLLENPW